MRIDPAPSLATCSGPIPAAQAAAAPALLPPGVRARPHGLRVIPVSGLSPSAFQPNSGVVVLPRMTAPASGRQTTCQYQILDRHRNAVEPPERLAPVPAPLGFLCGCQRAVVVDDAEGVELGLQPIKSI